jgi:hypothetical protein
MQGCYTLIRDDDLGLAEFVLDARLTFNSADWLPAMGGQTVYIARYPPDHFLARHVLSDQWIIHPELS